MKRVIQSIGFSRILVLLVGVCLLLLASCGQDSVRPVAFQSFSNGEDPSGGLQDGKPNPESNDGNDSGDSDGSTNELTCAPHRFQQKVTETNRQDILIVVDTSGSMSTELKVLGDQFRAFFKALLALKPNLSYQVGVLLAHGEGNHSGKFWQPDVCKNDPLILSGIGKDSYDVSVDTQLQCKLDNTVGESAIQINGKDVLADGEATLKSISKLVTGAGLETAIQQGFFRRDSGLALIMSTDENDICSIPPGWQERQPYETDYIAAGRCAGISSTSVYQALKAIPSDLSPRPLSIGALATLDTKSVNYSWGILGTTETLGYPGLISLGGGLSVDISENPDKVAADLEKIGENSAQTFSKLTNFSVPAGTVEIKSVTVIPATTPTQPVVVSNYEFLPTVSEVKIPFANAGQTGDWIEIMACK